MSDKDKKTDVPRSLDGLVGLINEAGTEETRLGLFLEFYGQHREKLQHLRTVGVCWGAAGEEVGAAKEAVATLEAVRRLESEIFKIALPNRGIDGKSPDARVLKREYVN